MRCARQTVADLPRDVIPTGAGQVLALGGDLYDERNMEDAIRTDSPLEEQELEAASLDTSEVSALDLRGVDEPADRSDRAAGKVTVEGDEIRIESLVVSDHRAADIVRERVDLGGDEVELVRRSVEIGLRALQGADTEIEAAYVRAEFDRVAHQVSDSFGGRAEEVGRMMEEIFNQAVMGEDSKLQENLASHADELAEQIAAKFDPERSTAVQHEMKEMVNAELQRLVQHLASENEHNPLQQIKGEVLRTVERESKAQAERDKETARRLELLQQEMVKLTEREDAQARVDEAEAAGTRKGLEFEDLVDQALEKIANDRGDAARHTGSELAEGGGKKGDTLVEIGAATREFPLGRIIFESKETRLSKPAAWKELDEAMEARAADFAVLVCAGEDRVPANTEELVEYEGNKLFVSVDRDAPYGLALQVAYRLAVARVSMAKDSSLRLDAAAVRDAVSEARNALDQVRTVKSHITHASTSAEKAYEAVEKLGESVRSQLDRVDDLVSVGDEDADSSESAEAA